MTDTSTNRSESWNAALSANPGEIDRHIPSTEIIGSIPKGLRGGRLLSNGPGWNQYGDKVIHPFDGHGYVRSFAFNEDGSVDLKARFVHTQSYKAEIADREFSVRGFATNPSDKWWDNIGYSIPRNVANTTIYRWGSQLIAGWEGGEPHALNPVTLETNGIETFNDLITGKITLAHFHHDPIEKTMILVNLAMGRHTSLEIHEINEQHQCIRSRKATIPHTAFVHDFSFSKNWVIFGGNHLKIRPFEFLKNFFGASTMLNSIATNTSAPGEMILIPRRSSEEIRRITLPKPVYVVHFVNSFEKEDGTIIIDACIFHDFPFGEEFGYNGRTNPFDPYLPDNREAQRLYRITIPPNSNTADWELLVQHRVDFPRIHPQYSGQEYSYMVGATRADTRFSDPFDSIILLDLHNRETKPQIWSTSDTVFVGEPIILPSTETDYISVILSDGLKQQTTLALLDTQDLSKGPICQITTPLLPVAFHGEWDPIGNS